MATQPDRAVKSFEHDDLDRKPFINRLMDALIDKNTQRATGIVVGVVGEWGSGKSSILNMLDQSIHENYKNGALVVRFDPWLISDRDSLVSSFFQQLIVTITEDSKLKKRLKGFVKIFKEYGKAVSPVANAAIPGAELAINFFDNILGKNVSLHTQRKAINDLLSNIETPVVVLIDELDRVEDDEVRTVAQLVRAVADFPSISYVLAYDHQRVIEALGGGERGAAYLEKIVQFPIPLPVMLPTHLRRLFEAQLKAVDADNVIVKPLSSQRRYEEALKFLTPSILKTPRDIKRLVGMYHVLTGMIGNEVDSIDLLAFTTLISKAPKTLNLIRINYRIYVEDGWRDEDYIDYFDKSEKSLEEKLEKRIPKEERSPALDNIIGFIFPRLSKEGKREGVSPISLCRYRPLLTVLNLGLLPGDRPSAEIREFLRNPPEKIAKELKNMVTTDDFGNLWQRLYDVYLSDDFDDSVHLGIWESMRLFVQKKTNEWPTKYEAFRNVVTNVTDLFKVKFFTEDENTQELGRLIFEHLIETGDVEIVPSILRRHIMHYGLYGWSPRKYTSVFLSKNETEKFSQYIVDREIPRLLSDLLLKSLWTPSIIYLINEVKGELNEDCRHYFNQLIDKDEALPAVSLFFNGPGYISEGATLEKYFDMDKLQKRIRDKLDHDRDGTNILEESVKLSFNSIIGLHP